MAKLPWFKFFPGDWLKDPNLIQCSHETKGVWIDLLCLMWESEERGIISGKLERIARAIRMTKDQFENVLEELIETKTAEVIFSKGDVRIMSRRITRDEKLRNNNKLYQKKHRSKTDSKTNISTVSGDNKPYMSEVRSQKSEERDKSLSSDVVKLSEYFLQNCHKKIKRESININNWNDAIEKMNRIDKRPFKEIREVFDFIFTDQFWSNQAVGPISLRKKNNDGIMRYDVVLAKMNQTSGASRDNPPERHLPSDIKI